MFRYKIIVEYDGSFFCGWQKQKDAISIQETIEKALFSFTKEIVNVFAAGRTDSGVHSIGQVAHFDLRKEWDEKIIQKALNHFIKPNISILNCSKVNIDFHARFAAKSRSYRYIIINREGHLTLMQNRAWHIIEKLSISLMKEGAELLIGTHDFTSFRTVICQAKSPIKTIDDIQISNIEDNIYFDITAPSFLHHMVRNIVGTLKYIGDKRWSPNKILSILAAKDRSKAGQTAPAHGLYLTKVTY